jgi:hypothetical protein
MFFFFKFLITSCNCTAYIKHSKQILSIVTWPELISVNLSKAFSQLSKQLQPVSWITLVSHLQNFLNPSWGPSNIHSVWAFILAWSSFNTFCIYNESDLHLCNFHCTVLLPSCKLEQWKWRFFLWCVFTNPAHAKWIKKRLPDFCKM